MADRPQKAISSIWKKIGTRRACRDFYLKKLFNIFYLCVFGYKQPSPSSDLRQERHLRELQQLQPPWLYPQASCVCSSQGFGPCEE